MDENNPSRKKRWGRPKPSHSNPHLVEERGRTTASHDPSSLSPSRNGSHARRPGPVCKLFGKITKRFARSARQSPNPEPTAASSSLHDTQPVQSTKDLTPPTLEPDVGQSSNSGFIEISSTNEAERLDPKVVHDRIANANKGLTDAGHVPTILQDASSATNDLPSVSDTIDTFSVLLKPLKAFNSIANAIADVHPYAKVALSIFTCASKMILDQAHRDDGVSLLLSKISEVYTFITEEEELAKIESMLAIYVKIAQQTLVCADFISHYAETKSAWMRLGKHILGETDSTIQNYNNVLDSLMQQFRDRAVRDTVVIVHHMVEVLDLLGMEYATGAGLNRSKCCLPNTRQDLLKDIQNWISSTEDGAPRILWLSGTAGKGKSAVAHTIANWYIESGGLGSFFCFDRTRQADRRQDKIFRTIASDLADCNPIVRRALAQAVHDHNGLKRTPDITKQWRELIVGPTKIASNAIAAPVLIVIDTLDESGDANSRKQILDLLAGKLNTSASPLSELPANFRVLLTSRSLEDIHDTLHAEPHVRHVPLDGISSASTELDIQLYISHKLNDLHRVFNDAHFKALSLKSDGLFEWARLACEYIKGTNKVGVGPVGRYKAVITGTSGKGTRLLDNIYTRILEEIMPEDEREEAIPVFCSVMGQVLASLEPLPMPALTAMRLYFPEGTCDYEMDRVLGPLGSLLTGTSDSDTPIRPLHASFYDFLTNKLRSHDFFVDASAAHRNLAFASLGVMGDSERGLRFNTCSLENSYLPNSSVPDLEKRVKESIPAELSYSCRFWGTHVGSTSFESPLAKEVEAFFDGERLLWWLEALALMRSLSGSAVTLSSIADWLSGHAEFRHVGDAIKDTLRFVRTFAPTILRSTPHLYLSALPMAPTQSRIFRKFAAKFPHTPRIVAGHVENWPPMEKIIHANDYVRSVAMSPDRKRIACGLYNGTIQVWDTETGEALCAPLQSHTWIVASVAFSPDGHRIVSGSWDHTVRVWDITTGKALGTLQGHTGYVFSVAISLDGTRIVSGSFDKTIRVWDMETREAVGAPLEGHTDYVRSVAISTDGHRIVSGSDDKTIRVWDMKTGQEVGTPLQGHTNIVLSVAISPDVKYIASGSADDTIRVWDMETGKALGAPLRGHTESVLSVAFSPNENRIVSGSYDQTIRVWDAKTGVALGSPLQGHTASILSITVSSDGSRIVSGSEDKTIRVWVADTLTGKASVATFQSHTGTINSVAISPDGHRIVSGSNDKTVRVWDIETGKALVAPLQGHIKSVRSVAISSDGKCIVSGSDDKSIRVWDIGTGEVLGAPFQGHTDMISSIAISPDGHRIVSGSGNGEVWVWDVATGKASGTPIKDHGHSVQSVAILLDGNRAVCGSADRTIRVWDMESRETVGDPLKGHSDWVRSVAVSPDAKYVVSGSDDTTVRVWDIMTGKALGAPLQGHTSWVYSVAISQNGHHIVSGSSDKTIRVWDMKTGQGVGPAFQGHTGPVRSVAISPDGKRIVSGSEDKTIRVWDIEFFNQPHSPAVCFSPNPSYALHSASSFLQDSSTPLTVVANEDGWVVGPAGRLLLWIPLNLHPVMYAPGNTLVIHDRASQFDLSRLAHGTSWHMCREQEAALSSL